LAFSDGLLAVAEKLIPAGRGRPDQASLRRAVSTAYYALFHRVIEMSAGLIVRGTGDAMLRYAVSRAFEHGAMKKLAQGLASGTPHSNMRPLIPTVPPELRFVANAFVRLQEARHWADYDVSRPISKTVVEQFVSVARRSLIILDGELSPELKRFLIVLPMWSQLERR
jgi:hypothetical protein